MHLCSEQEILSATNPRQIYSMNPDTLDQEYEAYCETYRKGQKFRELTNFVVLQQISYLYKLAKSTLAEDPADAKIKDYAGKIVLRRPDGARIQFSYTHHLDQKVCDTYSNDEEILFVIDKKMESRYDFYTNFVIKVQDIRDYWSSKDKADYEELQYYLPYISDYFYAQDIEKYVIILTKPHEPNKPCHVYPLRDVLDYFDGRLSINHVVSIVKRLYHIACHIDICGMTHNAITLDNIYFSPGRFIEPGEKFTLEDMRIVGLYGGWFFSTYKNEEVCAFPSAISDIVPKYVMNTRHSSFEVDMLAIKKVARELLGDVTGKNLYGVHSLLVEWFNRTTCEKNAYEEYACFEAVCKRVFGEPKFVEMTVSF